MTDQEIAGTLDVLTRKRVAIEDLYEQRLLKELLKIEDEISKLQRKCRHNRKISHGGDDQGLVLYQACDVCGKTFD